MKRLVDVLVLLGGISFLAAIIQKVFCAQPIMMGVMPTSFVKFSMLSLLLAIALSVRKA